MVSDPTLTDDPSRVTLRHVAERAGVHPATASRALNPETQAVVSSTTRDRVIEIANELGYTPSVAARTLRDGRSHLVGIVVADLENPYTARIIRGVENALEGRGMMALIAETQDDSERMGRAMSNLMGRDVDGIVCTGAKAGSARLLRKAFEKIPVVLADRIVAGAGIPTVAPDDRHAGRIAAVHLLGLGHRILGQVSGASNISSFERRAVGFSETVLASGMELIDLEDVASEPSVEEGRRLSARLMARETTPTAIFAHNDIMALGVLTALHELGLRCPEDVSVIGCDDLPFTEHTTPALTTVNLPGYQLGRFAAEMLVAMAEDPTQVPGDLTLTPTVTVRASTAEPSPSTG